jgi:hypothetical protein
MAHGMLHNSSSQMKTILESPALKTSSDMNCSSTHGYSNTTTTWPEGARGSGQILQEQIGDHDHDANKTTEKGEENNRVNTCARVHVMAIGIVPARWCTW